MRKLARHRGAGVVVGLGAIALIASGCGSDDEDTSKPAAVTSAEVSESAPAPSTPTGAAQKSVTQSSAAPSVTSESEVTVKGVAGREVTMTGPIAVRYTTATAKEKKILGLPLTGDHNAGTRDSGVVFQQFEGGVITARNADEGTPAYLTWGKIRDAWNVERDDEGKPVQVGTNGSAGPLGPVTSDVKTVGDVQEATFEHGKVVYNTATDTVTVTVNGKKVPAGV